MNELAVVLLLLVIGPAILAAYWYLKHRQTDAYLRRYEDEHYRTSRKRLDAVTGRRQRDGAEPPASGGSDVERHESRP